MRNLKAILASLFIISTFSTVAEEVTPAGVGCDTDSGVCFVILKSPFIGGTCENKGQIRMNPDKKGTTGQYSAALAAFMAGKKLEVGSVGCFQGHVEPSFLYVR
ncbi:hypothetical protein N474_23620 [Pseudoalteromonas luteoviolacea CPMOR-2]|uniref:hypothetical protein n=1 Tax=Pseudoalteromonas luteoviolacea TaxID=43657 RepID=UPI0007B04816|nr:hypothetical protein [Pseudoalteromonas luteoviolacea]KZN51842.1 hypothetical protein N474_23620 [Pseudoalteromonas luteoviolacea CPMOR-2]